MKELSIVIPVYNSEKTIGPLVESLHAEIASVDFEIILVNDGSKDKSDIVCTQLSQKYAGVNYICLMRNFGEFNAVMCGLNHAKGAYSVLIDDDFQNPPSEILKLLNKAKEGNFDVVYSYYAHKKHHWFRNFGSTLVNTLLTFLIKKPKNLYLSSFKLIAKPVVDEIIKFNTPFPYIDGFIFYVTTNIGRVEVKHSKRMEGKSSYTFRKLVSLFLTVIFSYSLLPIRLVLFAGVFSIVFACIYMLLYFTGIIGEWGSPVVIFLCGTLLCAVAILGEYIGKSLMIGKGVPQFVTRKKILKNAD